MQTQGKFQPRLNKCRYLSFIAVVPDLQYTIDMDRKTLERLLEIGEQLSRTRSLQPLLHYTMEVAIDLVGAECGYLVWLNDDGSFTYKVCIDQNGQHIPTPDEQISHTILQDVIQQKSPLVVYDAMSDPGLQNSQSVTDLKLRSVLCVPLISKGEALGGFYVENRSQSNLFTEDDIQPLEFLASQVTAAIENALLNEDLERRIANRTAELEQALQKVEQSLEDAVELDRMRTTFFAMVAHDIRAPLTTIIFALNLLREEIWANCDENQREWLDLSITTTEHIEKLTEDFLELLNAEINGPALSLEQIDLEAFLLSQYQIGRSISWPDGVEFRLEMDDDLPDVTCDPVRIQQVITNLLTNALKYTQQGAVTLYARKQSPDPGTVLIGVRDTGTGLDSDDLERVFHRFERIRKPRSDRQSLGLGLAICQELIKRHNGRIWAESAPGKGSDFKFTLPVA